MSDEEGNEAAYTYATFGKGAPPSPKGPSPMPNEQAESQSDVEALAALVKYHQSGGHEGDGSDENLARCAAALSTLPRDPQGLVEALRYYADPDNYLDGMWVRSAVGTDRGKYASAALAAWEAGK